MTCAHPPDAITAAGLTIRYPYAQTNAVGPLDFAVAEGERVLLLGPSGCGKSTVLHALTGLLPSAIPAQRNGILQLFGDAVADRSPAEWAEQVAILFQDVEQTLAGFTVADEIAFSLENRAYPAASMAAAVVEAMHAAGLNMAWRDRRIATLSGGQKQLVALAASLAQGGALTIADEPTANLAPQAAQLLAERILAPGRTTLIVDHRLGPLLDRIDRVIVLSASGQLLVAGSTDWVFSHHGAALVEAGIWTPPAVRLRLKLNAAGYKIPPLWRVEELLSHISPGPELAPFLLRPSVAPGPEQVRLERADCAPPFGPVVLQGISLGLNGGQVLGILGPNGAGKSTLAACLSGLAPPKAGRRHGPRGAIVFQNPEAHFSTENPRAEFAALGLTPEQVETALRDWGLSEQADQHPFTLSMGQKRRLALALMTETDRWPILILDEPTTGLDHRGTAQVARRIRALAQAGRAVAVITHDADFALSVCDRIVILAEGRIAAEGPAPDILCDMALLQGVGLEPPEMAPLLANMVPIPC